MGWTGQESISFSVIEINLISINIHCLKELKECQNAETQIFHFADPSVYVLWQPSAYIPTRQNDSVVFMFVSF